MPINTIQCRECGSRIHYSVSSIDGTTEVPCTRCGAVNTTSSKDLSNHVFQELKHLDQEREKEKQYRNRAFKPSFEGDDGLPHSNWSPGNSFFKDKNEIDIDEKLDSIKEKFSHSREELVDVGSRFSPLSTEDLISEYVSDDVDLSVRIPLEEKEDESKQPSFIENEIIKILAKQFFHGNKTLTNDIYLFISRLYQACREQKLDINSVIQNADTVITFADRIGVRPDTIDALDQLYADGTMNNLLKLINKYRR